ncbi:MAG TPA: lipid II flippase MurJ [Steroidobacteraceae bacterium]|nr:lipid II flippase MurJ [Steroidobacteraceae bacterium]
MSEPTDAFFLARTLPVLVTSVITTVVSSAIIPLYIRLGSESRERADGMLRSVLGLHVLASFALALVLGPGISLLSRNLGRLGSLYCSVDFQRLSELLSLIIVPASASSLLTSALQAQHKFAVAASSTLFPPLASGAAVIMGGRSLGIAAPALGMLVGYLMQLLLLSSAARTTGIPVLPSLKWDAATLRPVLRQYLPLAIGSIASGGTTAVNQFVASLTGSGGVTAFTYGSRLTALVLGVTAGGLGVGLAPTLSRAVAKGDRQSFRNSLVRASAFGLLVGGISVVLTITFSTRLLQVVFGTSGLSVQQLNLISSVQSLYCLQSPAYIIGVILVRGMAALLANDTVMRIALRNLALDIILAATLGYFFGVKGLALTVSIIYVCSAIQIATALKARLGRSDFTASKQSGSVIA